MLSLRLLERVSAWYVSGNELVDLCTLILIIIVQVFSPAKVIFAGVGVLLSVRI